MKCPFCGEEMERGDLVAEHVLVWQPEKQKELPRSARKKRVVLEDHPVWRVKKPGWVCRSCGKIILDHSFGPEE